MNAPTERPEIDFLAVARALMPAGATTDACVGCGLCASGCPAAGLFGMDPRRFINMAMLGMNEELSTTPWVWACTQCKRCAYVCPMGIDVSLLVGKARSAWPWDETREARIDLEEQRRAYEAFLRAWAPVEELEGVVFWNWFGFGGPEDSGYTPRNKPAAEVLRAWLNAPSRCRTQDGALRRKSLTVGSDRRQEPAGGDGQARDPARDHQRP